MARKDTQFKKGNPGRPKGSKNAITKAYLDAITADFYKHGKSVIERIKRHIYSTRDDARGDVIDYIEMFYNSRRRHGFNEMLSPVEYEKRFTERLVGV